MKKSKENLFDKYSVIKSKINVLEKELEVVGSVLLKEIKSLSEPVKTQYGTFTKQVRTTWKYTKAIDLKKKEIVLLQEKEQKTGKAKKEEKTSLRYIEVKI